MTNPATAPTPAPPPRPEYVEVSEFGPAKEWRWRWRGGNSVFILVPALFFICATVQLWGGGRREMAVAFLVVSIGYGYKVLADILNVCNGILARQGRGCAAAGNGHEDAALRRPTHRGDIQPGGIDRSGTG